MAFAHIYQLYIGIQKLSLNAAEMTDAFSCSTEVPGADYPRASRGLSDVLEADAERASNAAERLAEHAGRETPHPVEFHFFPSKGFGQNWSGLTRFSHESIQCNSRRFFHPTWDDDFPLANMFRFGVEILRTGFGRPRRLVER